MRLSPGIAQGRMRALCHPLNVSHVEDFDAPKGSNPKSRYLAWASVFLSRAQE